MMQKQEMKAHQELVLKAQAEKEQMEKRYDSDVQVSRFHGTIRCHFLMYPSLVVNIIAEISSSQFVNST